MNRPNVHKKKTIKKNSEHQMHESRNYTKEYLEFAALNFTMLLVAIALDLLVNMKFQPMEIMRFFMGEFFVVFALFKLINLKEFTYIFSGYDIIAKRNIGYAFTYPFIELALGIFYLSNYAITLTSLLTILVMSISVAGVIPELRRKSQISCACLGNVIKLPLSKITLIENIVMGSMAFVMLVTNALIY